MNEASAPRIVRCPGCGGPSAYAASNMYRPFCSARCKNNDFSAWASERYAGDAETRRDAGGEADDQRSEDQQKDGQRDNQ